MKRSKLQQLVLSQYKQFLAVIKTKPLENQENFRKYIKAEFKKNLKIKDFETIEYLLRVGDSKLKVFSQKECVNITVSK